MDSDAAKALGEFRRSLERAETLNLLPIAGCALDDLIDLLRRVAPNSTLAIEMAAALSAELHKRIRLINQPLPLVGNA